MSKRRDVCYLKCDRAQVAEDGVSSNKKSTKHRSAESKLGPMTRLAEVATIT